MFGTARGKTVRTTLEPDERMLEYPLAIVSVGLGLSGWIYDIRLALAAVWVYGQHPVHSFKLE